MTRIKTIKKKLMEIQQDPITIADGWDLSIYLNDDNLTYLVMNHTHREAIWIDPVEEDFELLINESNSMTDYRFIAVIDTHTHADHLSGAGKLARQLSIPLIMHKNAPCTAVDFRVSNDTHLSTVSGNLKFLTTAGHTWDGITPIWGPFIFTGDTILYGDTGRDDLPTGNPEEHYKSLQKIKAHVTPQQVILPGHDGSGGRASTWAHQLKVNSSLTQSSADFIREASAYLGPPPRLLKESLFHNFK